MKLLVLAIAAGTTAGLAACSAAPETALRVATGSVSQFLCTGTFVSGEDPDTVYADIFKPLAGAALVEWGLAWDVDRARRQVRTRFAGGFESLSVHRDGQGCILLHGADRQQARQTVEVARTLPSKAGARAKSVAPADPALAAALAAALERAFAETGQTPARRTKAVAVLYDGRLVAERYAPGFGPETPLPGFSVTKSVTNALVGILVRDGRLAVTANALAPEWRAADDPRRAITLDDLLRMRSGLDLGDSMNADLASLWNPSNRALFVERDMAAAAARAPLCARPGTDWSYADGNYLLLSRVIRDAAGGDTESVRGFARRELFDRLGMRNVVLGFDATGTPVGALQMAASARDWARLGQLYLDDGVVKGRRVLPEGWVDYSATPTPGARVGYGAGFWTNRGESFGAERRARFGMPRDAFFARGKFGQFVVVVPSARLVVARFGTTHGDEDITGVSALVADMIAALGGAIGLADLDATAL